MKASQRHGPELQDREAAFSARRQAVAEQDNEKARDRGKMESSPSAQSFIVPFPDPWRLQLSSPHRNFSHTSPEFTVVTNSFSRTPRRSLRSSSHTISQFTSTHLAQAQPIRTQAIPFPTAIQVVSVSHPLPSIPSTANRTSQPSRRHSNPGAGQLRPRRVLSPKPRPRPSRLQTTSPVSTPTHECYQTISRRDLC